MSFEREKSNSRAEDETFSGVVCKEISPKQRKLLEIIRTKLNKGILLNEKEKEFLDENFYLLSGGKQ